MTNNEHEQKDPLLVRPVKWAATHVVTTVAGAVVLGLVFYFVGSSTDRLINRITWSIRNGQLTGGQPGCEDPGWLEPIEIERASAYYEPDDEEHGGSKSYDGDAGTAWWQNWPAQPRYSYIAYRLREPKTVKLVCLIGGSARNATVYTHTGRPKTIELSTKRAGCEQKTVTLPNYVSPTGGLRDGAWVFQSIHYECETKWVGAYPPAVPLRIESIYPPLGDDTNSHVAISEVVFYG